MNLLDIFKTKQKPELPTRQWKTGMWVVYQTKPAILVAIGIPCTIHLVDEVGLTTSELQVGIEQLRQATYSEIPQSRRGITLEQAKELGYGA